MQAYVRTLSLLYMHTSIRSNSLSVFLCKEQSRREPWAYTKSYIVHVCTQIIKNVFVTATMLYSNFINHTKQQKERKKKKSAYSTRCSQAVTHLSTNRARRCLTSVIRREPVGSTWYGRRQGKVFGKEVIPAQLSGN